MLSIVLIHYHRHNDDVYNCQSINSHKCNKYHTAYNSLVFPPAHSRLHRLFIFRKPIDRQIFKTLNVSENHQYRGFIHCIVTIFRLKNEKKLVRGPRILFKVKLQCCCLQPVSYASFLHKSFMICIIVPSSPPP